MADTQQLLNRVRALSAQTGASTATLSRKLFGNGRRFEEIERGGSLTMATYERALARLLEMESDPATQGRAA